MLYLYMANLLKTNPSLTNPVESRVAFCIKPHVYVIKYEGIKGSAVLIFQSKPIVGFTICPVPEIEI